ncbi:GRAM domain-containing protein [Nonomuraea sp. MCN248]|uniref:GRAM domain-containing protein n=1 Tax=Nonomuraea corallina TaxID=2989783 RepID=A0ABT4S6A2_9ACTN|nr:GRAM domain-containing protein [Nonomuraea corallina]MDA0632680.1 GRAM domain-containing protein [Nonomuraea corallina]
MDEQELAELFQGTNIAVTPGEELLRKGNANLWRDREAVGGRLWLTSKWLIFRSHSMNIQVGVWAWPLEEVISATPVNTLAIVPNGMEIVLRSDERIKFVVHRRREWIDAIMKAKG